MKTFYNLTFFVSHQVCVTQIKKNIYTERQSRAWRQQQSRFGGRLETKRAAANSRLTQAAWRQTLCSAEQADGAFQTVPCLQTSPSQPRLKQLSRCWRRGKIIGGQNGLTTSDTKHLWTSLKKLKAPYINTCKLHIWSQQIIYDMLSTPAWISNLLALPHIQLHPYITTFLSPYKAPVSSPSASLQLSGLICVVHYGLRDPRLVS